VHSAHVRCRATLRYVTLRKTYKPNVKMSDKKWLIPRRIYFLGNK